MKRIISMITICALLLIGCSGGNEQAKSEDKKEDAPFIGEWTVYSVRTDSTPEASMAELLEEGAAEEPDVYKFDEDGTITSDTNIFGLARFDWTSKDGKYLLSAEASPNSIECKDDTLTIKTGDVEIQMIKGAKSAEDMLKDAGLYHVDELQIVSSSVQPIGNNFFTITYEIQNNTSDNITFKGISMEEYDVANTVLKSYYSYNKNATSYELAPGGKAMLELTFSGDDGISIVTSKKYTYTTSDGKMIEGSFTNPYNVQVQ